MNIDIVAFLISMVVLVISIAIHEFSHAITADNLGDDTPRMQGRITLNPLAHLDPMGTFMIVASSIAGFGIGWGKPVQVQPWKFRTTPRAGMGIVAIAGPISNVILAAVGAILFRLLISTGPIQGSLGELAATFLWQWVLINIVLALFNLIPVFPLDGFNVLIALLESMGQDWSRRLADLWQRQVQFGPLFLFLLLIIDWQLPALSPISWVLRGPALELFSIFMGLG